MLENHLKRWLKCRFLGPTGRYSYLVGLKEVPGICSFRKDPEDATAGGPRTVAKRARVIVTETAFTQVLGMGNVCHKAG